MRLPQPPEGILDPKVPWSRINPNSRLWLILKARLTGKPQGDGYNYSSYVNISNEEADRLIANMKKDPRGYPSLDQESGTPPQWMERQRLYQEWLVASYLNDPFIEEEIIEETSDVLVEAQEEIQEAETKAEVSEILEDKIDILEDIQEKIAPPPTENKIPDPWEGSYDTPKPKKKKRERRRLKRPTGVVKRRRKRRPSTSPGSNETPKTPRRPSRKKSFATRLGGSVRKTNKSFGSSLLDKLEGGGPLGENMGPSVLGAGIWIGKKINAAFKDAKKERERAIEAEQNGAEVPPEVKEKGYFIKKSLAHQFGGQAINQTVGAFFENIPSKQSKQKSGFDNKFDYGDGDPNKKKKQNDIKDLATGFRKVTSSLRGINRSIDQQIGLMSKLVGETSRVADTLEAIQNAIAKSIDVEIDSGSSDTEAQQATGDINIPDIDFSGLMSGGDGGIDWFDMLMAADDIRDIKNRMKGGGQRTTKRRGGRKITGNVPKKNRFRFPSLKRKGFSQGTAGVASPIRAMIGEAGPEIVTGSPKKFAAGGMFGGAGTNIVASQMGGGEKDLLKKVQPFANVMEMPFKVIGAQISGALASLVSAAGPFSGVIAKMFSPLLGGLATLFGLNQGAFAAEINSSAMTEKQGAKELSRFFAKFFKLFGIDIGEDDEEDKNEKNPTGASGQWGPLLDLIAGKESGGNYEALNPGTTLPGATKMTISEVAREAERVGKSKGGTGAVGKYQQLPWYLVGRAKAAGLDPDKDLFSPENQDLIITKVNIEGNRGGRRWLKGEMSDEEFMQGLSQEFSSLPNAQGKFHYPGQSSSMTPDKVKEALQKVKGNPTQAARGVVKPSSFLNQVQGVFEMTGPDTGYKIPSDLTGGQPVIGHGLEWLIKMPNKFIILPGVNKEYNVYQDPAKAFTRYEQIGNQGGVEVAGLVDAMDRLIFGGGKKGPSSVKYGGGPAAPKKFRGWAADEDGAEILRTLGGIPVKGASLPEGTVTPVAIPKDTVTGTTGAVVAMVQPVIQYVPVPVPGPERVEYVPANPFVAARTSIEMLQLQGLS